MTVLDQPPAASAGIIARIKAILLSPLTEWPKIAAEPATIGGLYTGYVVPLAAIAPVAGLIRGLVFGYGFGPFHFRPSIGGALSQAVLHYVLSLVGIFVMALIIDALAPRFGGRADRVQAMKVAAYSATAGWVAGIFSLIPGLGILGLVGLYSLFLLYLGLPRVMQSPEARALPYTALVMIAAIVLYLVIGMIGFRLVGMGSPGVERTAASAPGARPAGRGAIDLPDDSRLDMDKLQAAVGQLGAMAKQLDPNRSGGAASTDVATIKAVSTDSLKALLPESLPGGFARTEIATGTALGGTDAEATYENGSNIVKLSVTDLAAAGSLAALAGVFGIETDHETATGFDKVAQVDGRMTIQQFDRQSHAGKYGVLIDDRFVIDAVGTVGTFDDLRNAVAAVGPERVAALK